MGINLGSTAISNAKLGATQVSKLYLGSEQLWAAPTPTVVKALKFTASGTQTLGVNTSTLGSISPNFEYSTDGGTTWTTWTVANPISFGNGTDLYVRGSNTFLAKAGTNYTQFVFSTSEPVACSGNVMHLFDYTQDLTAFPDSGSTSQGVKYMFKDCARLTTPPELPATTLLGLCYCYMFSGCINLVAAPALPATTLGAYCYQCMFQNCVALAELPLLSATSLVSGCYSHMFRSCRNIKMSETQTGEYQNTYTFGATPDSTYADDMFEYTGGTFMSTPTVQTYYTSNTIVSA